MCEVLQVTLSNSKLTKSLLYNNQLRMVGHAKYPGVLLDSKLNFNKHVANMCGKANSILYFLSVTYTIVILKYKDKLILVCTTYSILI